MTMRKSPPAALPGLRHSPSSTHSRVGQLTHSMEVMENCRISWGEITTVEPAHFTISSQPLILRQGKLALGEPILRRVLRQIDDKGFTRNAQVGDWISVHWNWACDVLKAQQVEHLQRYTLHHIQLANLTL